MSMTKSNSKTAANMAVAFPMYDAEPLQAHYQAYWSALRQALLASGWDKEPALLPQSPLEASQLPQDLLEHWRDPRLLLSQACGFPYAVMLADQVHYVASVSYDQPYCQQAGHYCALIVTHKNESRSKIQDFAGASAVCSAPHSFSGMQALRWMIAPYVLAPQQGFFSQVLWSGSHKASLVALNQQRAQIASIDCVTWHFLSTFYPQLTQDLKIIAQTPAVPGLPLITGQADCVKPLFAALSQVQAPLALRITAVCRIQDDYQIFKQIKALPVTLS